ncbi:hypothetical protein [Bradyrhizobium cenepequi]
MSISQQADFLEYLLGRTTTREGVAVVETMMWLTAEEVEDLTALASRLRRMAPHENAIRLMVAGR